MRLILQVEAVAAVPVDQAVAIKPAPAGDVLM